MTSFQHNNSTSISRPEMLGKVQFMSEMVANQLESRIWHFSEIFPASSAPFPTTFFCVSKAPAASDLQEQMRLKIKLLCSWTPAAVDMAPCGEARAPLRSRSHAPAISLHRPQRQIMLIEIKGFISVHNTVVIRLHSLCSGSHITEMLPCSQLMGTACY